MTRTSNTPSTHKRRRKIISLAKGYRSPKNVSFKSAKEQLMRSWSYSYRDRKQRKRERRRLWILRINNSAREHNITYSRFIYLLKMSHIHLDRKQLANMSVNNLENFSFLLKKLLMNSVNYEQKKGTN